jgi:hypothetical protein
MGHIVFVERPVGRFSISPGPRLSGEARARMCCHFRAQVYGSLREALVA